MNQSPSSAETSRTAQSASKAASLFWLSALLRPIRAFRLSYLPLVMIYFAYGALGLIDVSRDMWIKERLTLSPAELAGHRGVAQPAVDRQDGVRRAGRHASRSSARSARSYILIGAAATACGMLTLAGAAGGWIGFAPPDQLYILGAMLIVIGTVIQDVVADAMSTEVVARRRCRRHPSAGGRRYAPTSVWSR